MSTTRGSRSVIGLWCENVMCHPESDVDLLKRKYKERDEHGRLPHHWMAAKAQTHTHVLAYVGVRSI